MSVFPSNHFELRRTALPFGAPPAPCASCTEVAPGLGHMGYTAPWHEAPAFLRAALEKNFTAEPALRRILAAPRCGFFNSEKLVWCDGPLVDAEFVIENGAKTLRINAYAPSGSTEFLAVSDRPEARSISSLGWESAAASEGSEGQRMRRCLVTALRAFDAPAHASPLVLPIQEFSLAEACLLVLVRCAFPARTLAATHVFAKPPPAAFRRLAQNLGLGWKAQSFEERKSPLLTLIGESQVLSLGLALNSHSPVIPASLFKSATCPAGGRPLSWTDLTPPNF